MVKRIIMSVLLCCTMLAAGAQWKWYNPMDEDYNVVQNQGFCNETGKSYRRLPERAQGKVSDAVWAQSGHSAGLGVNFFTNAPEIKVRYQVTGPRSMYHMPATGVSGIDLYSIDCNGLWHRFNGTASMGDTITYTFRNIPKEYCHDHGFEYRISLPLYNGVKWLEVGVPDDAEMRFIKASPERPIVVYGTSIVQGACASHPAMAWTNILQRSLDYPLINMGFSGNGLLAPEVIDFITETDPRLYVLDCLPNLTNLTADEVCRLTVEAVKQIRAASSAPILLVEHAGYANMASDTVMAREVKTVNEGSRAALEQIEAMEIPGVWYLSMDEIGMSQDGRVDNIHPSDYGMVQMAEAVEGKVRRILDIPVGTTTATIPVTQRREPDYYEWRDRWLRSLEYADSVKPRAVMIGNSITHYWGGEPGHRKKNGEATWNEYMAPAGFMNLGCGWDRVENVLWRIYHGEFDGYEAERVVMLIGTNNLDFNTDDEIAEGIRMAARAIKTRQPQAELTILAVLPRRRYEDRVRGLNRLIEAVAAEAGCRFVNPGAAMSLPDGSVDLSLFKDGLHPNDAGYRIIANQLGINQ